MSKGIQSVEVWVIQTKCSDILVARGGDYEDFFVLECDVCSLLNVYTCVRVFTV
jgi:hypothetical protein